MNKEMVEEFYREWRGKYAGLTLFQLAYKGKKYFPPGKNLGRFSAPPAPNLSTKKVQKVCVCHRKP
ncbi:hypothetical protein K6Y31_20530 [Motilimonas cestriensis]|uniref:Uncharacterized protein n=1 Tax=Motilimonas cestriensis TaxID=2742685 RepID=A0ABS8WDN8_9GAMM|nr:hypothetical protein [Motilimonas cestriensis]MCE2597164.1 hypothetical protein [Motilimonas cestriensis]